MEFIINNIDLFASIGIAIIIVVLGFICSSYLRRKGYINKDDVQLTEQLLEIAKLITTELKFEDEKKKDDILLVFEISQTAVDYIEQTMTFKDNKKKKEAAYKTVIEILNELNIEVTENRKRLIEISIEAAVNHLPPIHSEETIR